MANTLSNCSAKTAAIDANHPAMLAHAANVATAAAKNKASLATAAAKKDAPMVPSRQSLPRVAKSNSVYGINANALFSTSTHAQVPPICHLPLLEPPWSPLTMIDYLVQRWLTLQAVMMIVSIPVI
jgi:hypothetical protein